jgi:hypothetical protein
VTKRRIMGIGKPPLLGAAVLICGLLLAGCDEHIEVIRDSGIPVHQGNTWAWRPMEGSRTGNQRPVVSRDVISRRESIARDSYERNDLVRERVRIAIEQTLSSKGLQQVSDPREADFLVEYHLAVRKRDVTPQRVYPSSYPGIVCGRYGCWESWGWGPPVVSYENVRYREGTVVFDLVDQSSMRLAFRAIGQKPVNRHTFTQGEISEFVHHMLDKLKING